MKKSVISLLTLVLVLVNVVLTALLTFTILPQTKQANKLIEKVAGAIELDMSAGQSTGGSTTSLEKTEVYSPADDMTISLKSGADGSSGIALVKIVINLNKDAESYKKGTYTAATMNTYDSVIQRAANEVISKYTVDEFNNKKQEICEEIKDELGRSFDGDLITSVGFAKAVVQKTE